MTGDHVPPNDDEAPFLSLSRLLDRDRQEHADRHIRDYDRHDNLHALHHRLHEERHQRDHEVTVETAHRMEREVEDTRHALELNVDRTAQRIENAVKVALDAVAATATVHAEAHAKEHLAHREIHTVESEQVRKAELNAREAAQVLSTSLQEYKHQANEWRSQLRDQEGKFLRKEEANVIFEGMRTAMDSNAAAILQLRETVLTTFSAQTGKTEGVSDTTKLIVGAVAFIATLLGIVGAVIALAGP